MKDVLDNIEYFATFVYINPQKSLHDKLWEKFLALNPGNKPRMLLEDFNNITCIQEKWGGVQNVHASSIHFVDFLN